MTKQTGSPGWYDVGRNADQKTVMRYWDGSEWTDDRRPVEATDDLVQMNQAMLRELRSIKSNLTVIIILLLPLIIGVIAGLLVGIS